MIKGIFYNKHFDSLLIYFTLKQSLKTWKTKKNIFYFPHVLPTKTEKISAINLINLSKNYKLTSEEAIQTDNQRLINYLSGYLTVPSWKNNPIHFVVGQIKKISPVPNKPQLKWCQVQIKPDDHQNNKLSIICGGNNVHLKAYVIVATVGTMMPDQRVLFLKQWNNITSKGMICSAFELGLSQKDNGGIVNLSTYYGTKIGKSFWKLFEQNHGNL